MSAASGRRGRMGKVTTGLSGLKGSDDTRFEGENMFERYTEKARRVIFFARYEASQFGSPYIETEHLLLGLCCGRTRL